jgi:hypothetical protein
MKTESIEVIRKPGSSPKALITIPKNTPIREIIEYLARLKKMNIDSAMIKVDLFHF